MLVDLKEIAAEQGTAADFSCRLGAIRERHMRKRQFIKRLHANDRIWLRTPATRQGHVQSGDIGNSLYCKCMPGAVRPFERLRDRERPVADGPVERRLRCGLVRSPPILGRH